MSTRALDTAIDDLIDRWQAAWVGRDRGAFAALCAPDVHYEDPLCGEPLESPDALADHAARLWAAFPDARIERTGERLSDGRFVAAPFVCYCELDPDRRRLWRVRAFFDAYDAAVQLGVLPARGTLGERALFMLRGFGLRARG